MTPQKIQLLKKTAELLLIFNNEEYRLSAEYLRVFSPSAEVRGHGKPVLQSGKQHVTIVTIKPVGNYAIQIYFDDQHHTGIFSWDYLYQLCINYDENWQQYLQALQANNLFRDPDQQAVQLKL